MQSVSMQNNVWGSRTTSYYFCCCVPLVAHQILLQSTVYSDVLCSDENVINHLKQYGLYAESAVLCPGKKSRSAGIHAECGKQMYERTSTLVLNGDVQKGMQHNSSMVYTMNTQPTRLGTESTLDQVHESAFRSKLKYNRVRLQAWDIRPEAEREVRDQERAVSRISLRTMVRAQYQNAIRIMANAFLGLGLLVYTSLWVKYDELLLKT